MMTTREYKEKSHNGKKRFINQDRAEKAIDRLRKAQKLKLSDLTAYQCTFCSKWHIGTLRRNHMAKPSAAPKPKPENNPKPKDPTEPVVPAQEAAPHLRFVEMSAALQIIETEAVEFLENEQEIPDTVLLKVSAYLLAGKAHVDDVVRWMSSCRSRIAFLKEEENRVAARRKQGEAMMDRVKKYLRTFIDQDFATSNRLEGNIYHLRTQANSQARLVYDQEKWKDEIPVEFHQQTVTFAVDCSEEGNSIVKTLEGFALAYDSGQLKMTIGNPTLNEKLVRETLKDKNKGDVPGAKLVPGRHLRDSAPKTTEVVKS